MHESVKFQTQSRINSHLSLFLDISRAIAALMVLITHFSYLIYQRNDDVISKMVGRLTVLGPSSVIIFFVLSGYVIAFTCHEKHTNFKSYLLARACRILPSYWLVLLLTPFLDILGRIANSSLYPERFPSPILDSHGIITFLVNLLFLQETNLGSIRYFSDGPLWSLGYEVFYYLIFGIFFYCRSNLWLLFLTVTVSYFLFLKALILFPIWLLGVLTFYINRRRLGIGTSRMGILFLLGIFLLFFLDVGNISSQFKVLELDGNLGYSGQYISKIIIGILFSALIILAFNKGDNSKEEFIPYVNSNIASNISLFLRWLAGFSYTLYIFHVPIMMFLTAILPVDRSNLMEVCIIPLLTIFICSSVSQLTEKNTKFLFLYFSQRLKILP